MKSIASANFKLLVKKECAGITSDYVPYLRSTDSEVQEEVYVPAAVCKLWGCSSCGGPHFAGCACAHTRRTHFLHKPSRSIVVCLI